MPLLPGNDPKIVSHNIRELQANGHPHDVAVAAALHNAGLKRANKMRKVIDQHNNDTQPPQTGAVRG